VAVLLGSAGVHAALIPEHVAEAPVLGTMFAVSVVLSLATAGALLGTEDRRALLLASGLLLVFALAYAYTRVTSLEALGIPHEEPDVLGLCTVALELAGVAFALRAVSSLPTTRAGGPDTSSSGGSRSAAVSEPAASEGQSLGRKRYELSTAPRQPSSACWASSSEVTIVPAASMQPTTNRFSPFTSPSRVDSRV